MRWKDGATGPPECNEEGKFICENCDKVFDDLPSLGSHRRFCDNDKGHWRCGWCDCSLEDCGGKIGAGPDGAKTLCQGCSARFKKHGTSSAPTTNAEGKFVCGSCTRQFDTVGALGGHKRFCDKGSWKCGWCECRVDQCAGKGPGPEGPKTLCSACSARFRAGHTAAPLRDEQGNFLCDSCQRAFVSMGALGGHRRFCQQLSAAAVPRKVLVDDLLVEDSGIGAAEVALPETPASRLPPSMMSGVLAAYDFVQYFYTAIAPKATLLSVTSAELLEGHAEDVTLRRAPPAAEQSKCARPADPAGRGKKLRKALLIEEHWDRSHPLRQMLMTIQAARFCDWEEMLMPLPSSAVAVADASSGSEDDGVVAAAASAIAPRPSESPQANLLFALHVLTTQLLWSDLLTPSSVAAGTDFCSSLGDATQKLLPGCPFNAHTWPELLRMVLLARAVAHAPKKRSVAINAMLAQGWGNAQAATAAAAALGGGHSVSVWSAGTSGPADGLAGFGSGTSADGVITADGGVDDDEGGEGGEEEVRARLSSGDWAAVADSLGSTSEYDELPISMRCAIVECLAHLLMETAIAARFFEATGRASEKLQDLKRTEYKVRNAVIEGEEQAKLAAKYNISRPSRLSHDRTEKERQERKRLREDGGEDGEGEGGGGGDDAEEQSGEGGELAAILLQAGLDEGGGDAEGGDEDAANGGEDEEMAADADDNVEVEDEEHDEQVLLVVAEARCEDEEAAVPATAATAHEHVAEADAEADAANFVEAKPTAKVTSPQSSALQIASALFGGDGSMEEGAPSASRVIVSGESNVSGESVGSGGGAGSSSGASSSITVPRASMWPLAIDRFTSMGSMVSVASTIDGSRYDESGGEGGGTDVGGGEGEGEGEDGSGRGRGRGCGRSGRGLGFGRGCGGVVKKPKREPHMPTSKNPSVRRGDLDNMRLRKDELRKKLDEHFALLQRRVGRFRSEPIGLDRDKREYYLIGGLFGGEGDLCPSDQARLLVRIRKPVVLRQGRPFEEAEAWRLIGTEEALQSLMKSLRPAGEREHHLEKALLELAPMIREAMAVVAQAAADKTAEKAAIAQVAEAAEVAAAAAAAAAVAAAKKAVKSAKDEVGRGEEGEEDEEDAEDEDDAEDDAKAKDAEPAANRWTYAGRQSYAQRMLNVSWSKERREQHRRQSLEAIGRSSDEINDEIECDNAARRMPNLLECLKLEMLDVFAALPVAPPNEVATPAEGEPSRTARVNDESPSALRPGSDESRKRWVDLVATCEDLASLGAVLLQYVKAVPKTAFRKGFRKWWLADGGLEDAKAKVDKELRKLGTSGEELKAKVEKKSAVDKDKEKEREKEKLEKAEKENQLPPARSDSVHQVLLRLQLLDAGLTYC